MSDQWVFHHFRVSSYILVFNIVAATVRLSSLTRHEVMTSIEVYDVIIDRTVLYPCNKSQGDKIYKINDDLVTKS